MKRIATLGIASLLLAVGCSSAGDELGSTEDALTAVAATAPKMSVLGKTAALDALRVANTNARTTGATLAKTFETYVVSVSVVDYTRFDQRFAGPLAAYVNAEMDTEIALELAWESVVPAAGQNADAGLALRIAALETEVWARRAFGPTSHTRVPGLVKSDACRGGVLEDGLFERHASSQTRGLLGNVRDEADALRRVATQIACMGAADARRFEDDLRGVTDGIEARMIERKLGALVPQYRRMMAPVMLLVLDAGKHRGEYSGAYEWFAKRKTDLRTSYAALGVSAGRTAFFYDRRRGDLVGFPECRPGAAATGCVDPMVLLDSITDPRALGLGTCGFDAMVARGPAVTPQGTTRYTCPSADCGSPTTGAPTATGPANPFGLAGSVTQIGTSPTSRAASQFRSIFPSMAGASDASLGQNLCIGGSAAAQNLAGSANETCIDQLFTNAPTSPFDSYLTCVAEGITGPGVDGSMAELGGIPTGPACDLSDEAQATPPQKTEEEKKQEAEAKAKAEADKAKEKAALEELEKKAKEAADAALKAAKEKLEKIAKKEVKKAVEKFVKEKAAEIAAAVGRVTTLTLAPALAAAPGAILGGGQAMAEAEFDKQMDDAIRRGDIPEQIRLEKIKTDTGGKPGDMLPALRKGQTCSDPMRCSNKCSSLGAQVDKATACSKGFVDDVMRRAGIPGRSVPPQRDFGRVSKPRPDAVAPGEDASGVCVGGSAPARQGPSVCGAVLCVGGVGAGTASTCCGGAMAHAAVSRAANCYSWNCGDRPIVVDPVTGACGCEATTGTPVVPGNPLDPGGPLMP